MVVVNEPGLWTMLASAWLASAWDALPSKITMDYRGRAAGLNDTSAANHPDSVTSLVA